MDLLMPICIPLFTSDTSVSSFLIAVFELPFDNPILCLATSFSSAFIGIAQVSYTYRYFQQTAQLMNEDPTILAVSAHNTYSFAGLGLDPGRLLRGVTPPQWGWMATRRLIQDWVPGLWVNTNILLAFKNLLGSLLRIFTGSW